MSNRKYAGCDQVDSIGERDPRYASYPVQSTDDTEVKGFEATSPKTMNETITSLDSGLGSIHLSSSGSRLSLVGYNPVDTENVYCMDYPRRGHLLVINNRYFDKGLNMPERSGTDVDAACVYSTFKRLGFEVNIQTNLKREDMLRLFIQYKDKDHRDCDCFAVAILSHGDEGAVYGTNGTIEIKKLIEPLKSCASLVGKPKLIFIQACQGYNLDEGIDVTDAEVDAEPQKPIRLPKEADFLYAYSTTPGYYAFRHSAKGSCFIQALAKVFQEQGSQMEITRLLTRVNRMIAYEFESNTQDRAFSKKKQMPCIMSTLTKDLYFPPKK